METLNTQKSASSALDMSPVTRFEDSGSERTFIGNSIGKMLFTICLLWSLYQLYIASPLPYYLANEFGSFFVIGSTKARLIHYAFAVFLVFCIYPAFIRSSRARIPLSDWFLASIGAASALYIFVFYDGVAFRSGAPNNADIAAAIAGVLVLLEATRRTIGLPLTIVAVVFISYGFIGPYLPDIVAHGGNSFSRMADHMWLSTEGVFGLALGVSSSLIFLFVLFGALLEKAGAGSYFIRVSFSLLGHLQGGPAKAAVISSAATGIISGSALANVMTTGTFTIPLMKKIGFPAEKAGAIESSSSINGQLMPPVMGAAAFIMTEFVGISYADVVKHAFLPAVLSYLGLFYIVHLESVKMKMMPLERVTPLAGHIWLIYMLTIFIGACVCGLSLYYFVLAIQYLLGDASATVLLPMAGIAYVSLVYIASKIPDEDAGIGSNFELIPDIKPTILSGLYHLMPVIVLIWLLVVERYSPGLAVFWAVISLLLVMLTQGVLLSFFRGSKDYLNKFLLNARDIVNGLVAGARNMIGIAIALACAGIIVGIVSLTGIAMMMVDLIGVLAGDSLMLMLILTALISIILGLGLPTTANYVVVATLMAPVVVTIASQNGLVVPLIAVHLFVFYAGLMSGNTPPVAVDAYAAAALAKADPMKTSFQAFFYSVRTMVLPFIFIFNTELLLIGIESYWHLFTVIAVSTIGMLAFVAASMGFLFVKTSLFERVLLLLSAFMLSVPSFWVDLIESPYRNVDPLKIFEYAETQPANSDIRVWASGNNFSGKSIEKVVILPLGEPSESGRKRLENAAGLDLSIENGQVVVTNVAFNKVAAQKGINFGWTVDAIEVRNERIAKQWVYIPGFVMLFIVLAVQFWSRKMTAPVMTYKQSRTTRT